MRRLISWGPFLCGMVAGQYWEESTLLGMVLIVVISPAFVMLDALAEKRGWK